MILVFDMSDSIIGFLNGRVTSFFPSAHGALRTYGRHEMELHVNLFLLVRTAELLYHAVVSNRLENSATVSASHAGFLI